MKKLIYILMLLALNKSFAQVQPKKPGDEKINCEEIQQLIYKIGTEELKKIESFTLGEHGNHFISYKQLSNLALDYLTDIYPNASIPQRSWGGYLPKSEIIKITKPACDYGSGIIYYLGINDFGTPSTADDKIILAYSCVTNFNFDDDYFNFIPDQLFDTCHFSIEYTGAVTDTPSIRIFLNSPIQTTTHITRACSLSVVKSWASKFESVYGMCRNDISNSQCPCNINQYGFISAKELQEAITRETEGFHFYLGYDKSEKANKIRLFMIPCNDTYNQMNIPIGSTVVHNSYIERAWP